jgi:hypothetical protein
MASSRRAFDGWRNSVMTNARNLGPNGQMAVLMQQEMESVSDATHHLAHVQQHNVRVMQAGFDQMSDSLHRLAWIQQRAAEAQLDSLYRLSRIQGETNDELRHLNTSYSG